MFFKEPQSSGPMARLDGVAAGDCLLGGGGFFHLSQIAQPGVLAAGFEVGKPAAGWREHQNQCDPDEIDNRKPVPIAGRRIGGKIRQTGLKQEGHRAVFDGREEYR